MFFIGQFLIKIQFSLFISWRATNASQWCLMLIDWLFNFDGWSYHPLLLLVSILYVFIFNIAISFRLVNNSIEWRLLFIYSSLDYGDRATIMKIIWTRILNYENVPYPFNHFMIITECQGNKWEKTKQTLQN